MTFPDGLITAGSSTALPESPLPPPPEAEAGAKERGRKSVTGKKKCPYEDKNPSQACQGHVPSCPDIDTEGTPHKLTASSTKQKTRRDGATEDAEGCLNPISTTNVHSTPTAPKPTRREQNLSRTLPFNK